MNGTKNQLNDILSDLYDMEYEQEAFEYILTRIEQSYGDFENKETKLVLAITKVFVDVVGNKLQGVADRLDEVLSKHNMIL